MRSPLAMGMFEGQDLEDGFNDLSTTVELGQASNAMRRASSTLTILPYCKCDWLIRLRKSLRNLTIQIKQ